MRKFQRGPEPDYLAQNWEAWGRDWEQHHAAGKVFYWHKVAGEPVNQKLLPLLKAQTQSHCSFCDSFPVSPPSRDTIEHFRPKSRFPREAFHWPNLYFCCDHCQQKEATEVEESVLRPDAADYEFDRYFRWDFSTGELLPNERSSSADQQRARETIRFYRLNEKHSGQRKREARRFLKLTDEHLDDWPYRDFLERH